MNSITETPRIDRAEKMADSIADFAEMTRPLEKELAAKDAEIARIRSKADECWGAANYRLKYLACLFRALGRPDDETIESNVSAAAEQIRELITRAEKAEAKLRCADDVLTRNGIPVGSTPGDELVINLIKLFSERDQLRADLADARADADRLVAAIYEAMREARTLECNTDPLVGGILQPAIDAVRKAQFPC